LGLLDAIAASEIALGLRFSRWGYAAVLTGHVFGIALLVGPIVALDLRLLGAWASVPREALARVLVPVATTGLALALPTGALLFAVRAPEYGVMPILWLKLALITAGLAQAASLHLGPGLASASERRLRVAGALSLAAWVGALVAGRMIAFLGD
jgi:hypothetical protein